MKGLGKVCGYLYEWIYFSTFLPQMCMKHVRVKCDYCINIHKENNCAYVRKELN